MESDKAEIGKKQSLLGSIAALIASYYRSAEYSGMADSTKRAVRNILERFRAEHGDKRVAHLEKRHVLKIMADKSATPDAANRLLRLIRTLMAHAIDLGCGGGTIRRRASRNCATEPKASPPGKRNISTPSWLGMNPEAARIWPFRSCSTRASGAAMWCAWAANMSGAGF